jgi:hypothetical protein
MKNNKADYNEIRERMRAGDIVAFSGNAAISKIIKAVTRSNVSHVGILCHTHVVFNTGVTVEIMESIKEGTCPQTGKPVAGVIRNRLSTRIKNYDGCVWWLPLSERTRTVFDTAGAVQFLMQVKGRPYDRPQAVKSAFDMLDKITAVTYATQDYSELFCSELAAAALKAGGVLAGVNPSETTPADLCALPIFAPDYYQLKGPLTGI